MRNIIEYLYKPSCRFNDKTKKIDKAKFIVHTKFTGSKIIFAHFPEKKINKKINIKEVFSNFLI